MFFNPKIAGRLKNKKSKTPPDFAPKRGPKKCRLFFFEKKNAGQQNSPGYIRVFLLNNKVVTYIISNLMIIN